MDLAHGTSALEGGAGLGASSDFDVCVVARRAVRLLDALAPPESATEFWKKLDENADRGGGTEAGPCARRGFVCAEVGGPRVRSAAALSGRCAEDGAAYRAGK